ncbi:MAG: DUF924 family protein [Myxococcota bacterium]
MEHLHPLAAEILEIWFGPTDDEIASRAPTWWKKDPVFDQQLAERFGGELHRAAAGSFSGWERSPHGSLALVVMLDQFPRNSFRGDPRSFAFDAAARAVCHRAVRAGHDRMLKPPERVFLYMPLMHSEHVSDHRDALVLFEAAAVAARGTRWEQMIAANFDFAQKHAKIIHRFGRYPHRNEVLGRDSTPEESAHVAEHGGF